MCGAVRKGGSLTTMFPRGAVSYQDIPWFLFEAINQGFIILSWYENYTEKEVPPSHIWEDVEGLEQWFNRIHDDRGYASAGDTVPDEDEMMGNDLARMFRD